MGLFKRIFCRHKEAVFVRNIYGDEINHVSLSKVYRSWWRCCHCGAWVARQELVEAQTQQTTAAAQNTAGH